MFSVNHIILHLKFFHCSIRKVSTVQVCTNLAETLTSKLPKFYKIPKAHWGLSKMNFDKICLLSIVLFHHSKIRNSQTSIELSGKACPYIDQVSDCKIKTAKLYLARMTNCWFTDFQSSSLRKAYLVSIVQFFYLKICNFLIRRLTWLQMRTSLWPTRVYVAYVMTVKISPKF